MTHEEQRVLLSRYLEGICTDEEKIFVESWYKDITANAPDPEHIDFEVAEQTIWSKLDLPESKHRLYKRWIAAATIITILCISAALILRNRQPLPQPIATAVADVPPGGNKAILQLADGSKIALDQAKEGEIAQASGVTITKTSSGQITYQIKKHQIDNSISYNTITTPNGGQYQIILPDGSKVTLNAASSLRYPTQFVQSERTVTLTGEAYFDVKSDPQEPFVVVSSMQQVKVLGTHFNVCCYSNELIRTTLVEGKVEISQENAAQKAILKPGDQSIVSSKEIVVKQVNVEEAIAWKDGLFVFNHTPLNNVLQQLGRWYDVDVDVNDLPDKKLDGEIPRQFSLLQVLAAIEQTSGVKLTLKARRIVIQ